MKARTTSLWALSPLLLACQGTLGTESDSQPELEDYGNGVLRDTASDCASLGEGIHPGPAPIRRLTHFEYDRTVADLTGDTNTHASEFPPEARALGFHGIAAAQSVSVLLVEAYQKAAQDVAENLVSNLDGLLGCDAADASCVSDFIQEFGSRAYRRPLSESEAARLRAVFEWGRDKIDIGDGIAMVIEVLLQSPDFLYRPEFGAESVANGVVRLSSREMATRLSYLFLSSMPDAELRQAAEADALKTKDQVLTAARRLLSTDAARTAVRRFHAEWLDLKAIEHIDRDPAVYPGYTAAIPALMERETEAFIEHVIFDDDATLKRLLTAPYTMMNAELAAFYGVQGITSADFVRVDTTPSERAGLLTQASLLAHHAQPLSTSPVHRGKFIRESILCQFLEPPPADIVIMPPDLDPNLTTRERFNQHSEDAACRGCHQLMDPVGLGFEHYDSVGRYRTMENGKPIDASGELVFADVEGAFYGGVELGAKLAESEEVQVCVTRQWMRYTQGRSETPEDACSVAELGKSFKDSGGNILGLLEGLTQTDAFLYKKVTP